MFPLKSFISGIFQPQFFCQTGGYNPKLWVLTSDSPHGLAGVAEEVLPHVTLGRARDAGAQTATGRT